MNRIMSLSLILILLSITYAQQQRGPVFSGVFESSVLANLMGDDDGARYLTYGFEEYANVRMQSRVGDMATFFGAVNLIAAMGDYALRTAATGAQMAAGENYAAAIELERLHFKLKGENADLDAGLMRMPFGYGLAWKPLDFLNPPNPLNPDARPRAVLGGSVTYYPIEELKLQGFATTGRDPMSNNSGLAGLSADKHWAKGSVQLLYALEHSNQFPASDSSKWTHRAGASVKADIELGIVMEALYVYNREIENKTDGLSLSAGFDYSLLRGNLIILAEYLYNGAASSTSVQGGGNFINEHYAIAGATWRFSDFTNVSLQIITDIDEKSVIPMAAFNSEISQGVTLSLMAQALPDNRHILLETKLKLRF